MFITIVIIFFFSWGLLWPLVLVYRYSLERSCLVQEAITLIQISPGIYTAVKPLIYFVYSTNFREGLKNMFACCTLSSVKKTKQNNVKTQEIELRGFQTQNLGRETFLYSKKNEYTTASIETFAH